MPHTGYTIFNGASGEGYPFDIYTRGSDLDSTGGVYIFVNKKNCLERSSEVPCDPILIGETDDLSELDENCECLNEHGADLLCVLVENNEDQRRKIYDDISEEYQDVTCE